MKRKTTYFVEGGDAGSTVDQINRPFELGCLPWLFLYSDQLINSDYFQIKKK